MSRAARTFPAGDVLVNGTPKRLRRTDGVGHKDRQGHDDHDENQLVFWIDGVQYEWLSKSRIVPADGSFQIWMKLDPTFSFPPQKAPPEALDGTKWSLGAFDKLPGEKKEE